MKIIKWMLIGLASIFLIVATVEMYKFNYLTNLKNYGVDGDKIKMHHTWDVNEDGVNDCENEGSCDHIIDYSKPKL